MSNLEITSDGQIRETETEDISGERSEQGFGEQEVEQNELWPKPDIEREFEEQESEPNHERYFIAPRQDDARFKTDRKTFEVNKMWEVHKEIVRLLLLGWKNVDIAEELHISEVMVSYTRNSKVVQSQLSIMGAARDADTIDLAREIREKAPKALELLEGIIKDNGATHSIALAAKTAENWMDRAGYGAPKRIEALVAHLTAEEIEGIKKSAVIDAEASSIITKSEEGTE